MAWKGSLMAVYSTALSSVLSGVFLARIFIFHAPLTAEPQISDSGSSKQQFQTEVNMKKEVII